MKADFKKLFKAAGNAISKHSPELLIALGVVGTGTAIVMAVVATPKAMNAISEEIDRKNEENLQEAEENGLEEYDKVESLTKREVVKVAWKYYVPTALTAAVSIGCIIGANEINHKRNAVLATAYELTTTAMDEYKEAVIDEVGEEKAIAIEDKVVKKRKEKADITHELMTVIDTGNGDTLYYDQTSARYFRSDIVSIGESINKLNFNMMQCENYVSLNDFYEAIGLPCTSTGDDYGWNVDGGLIEYRLSSQIGPKDEPCAVLVFTNEPYPTYRWS